MTPARARRIAIACIQAEIKRLAVNANLHDRYQADAPACVEASKRRKQLLAALAELSAPAEQ